MAGFPNSPSIGETYTLGTKVWEWDGTIWKIKTTGAVGPQGVQGAQGNQGTAGAGGVQGNQGRQGSVGPQGNQGRQGLAGSNGTQGNQGNQGLAGTQGNQGRQGIEGPTGFVSTPADLSTLTSGKVRVSPLWATVDLSNNPDGNYWIQSSMDGTIAGGLLNGIEYDYGAQVVRFNKYTETSVSIGSAAANLTADLDDGNIFIVFFGGYTGTCTIDITGHPQFAGMVPNILFYFTNSSGNTAPTITFTSKGLTGKVLFSEETGAPVFSNTPQAVFLPLAYMHGDTSWFGGSQLTFDL